jgi:hypothetical protein
MPTPAQSLASAPPFPDVGLQAFIHHQWLVGSCIDELCSLRNSTLRDDGR